VQREVGDSNRLGERQKSSPLCLELVRIIVTTDKNPQTNYKLFFTRYKISDIE
jgi:hypothetical protein